MTPSLLHWLFETSIYITLLYLCVSVLLKLFPDKISIGWQYILLLIIFVRLFMPILPQSKWTLMSFIHLQSAITESKINDSNITAQDLNGVTTQRNPVNTSRNLNQPRTLITGIENKPHTHAKRITFSLLKNKSLIILGIWLTGVISVFIFQYRRFMIFNRDLVRPERSEHERISSIISRAKQNTPCPITPKILIGNTPAAAYLFGIFRPTIVLSRRLLKELNDQEITLVIQHELTHITHCDHIINWLSLFATAIHWFNPLTWKISRHLEDVRELYCDQKVLKHLSHKQRKNYGFTLLKLVDLIQEPNPAINLVTCVKRKLITRRIKMTIARQKMNFGLKLFCTFILCIIIWCGYTRADNPKTNSPKTVKPEPVLMIKVTNANELIKAIGNNRIIELTTGNYNVSRSPSTKALELNSITNLTLRCIGEEPAHILIDNPNGIVIPINNCKQIILENLRIGHNNTIRDAVCSASVLSFHNTQQITLNKVLLYGCGTYGIISDKSVNMTMNDSEIYECSDGILWLTQSHDFQFNNCKFHHNGTRLATGLYSGFSIFTSNEIKFNNCIVSDNKMQNGSYNSMFDIKTSNIEYKNTIFKNNSIPSDPTKMVNFSLLEIRSGQKRLNKQQFAQFIKTTSPISFTISKESYLKDALTKAEKRIQQNDAVWFFDFDEALAKAKKQNKSFLLLGTDSVYCDPCKFIEKEIFDQADFRKAAKDNDLILLKLDTQGDAISPERLTYIQNIFKKYKIYSFPTLMILNSRGEVQKSIYYTKLLESDNPAKMLADLLQNTTDKDIREYKNKKAEAKLKRKEIMDNWYNRRSEALAQGKLKNVYLLWDKAFEQAKKLKRPVLVKVCHPSASAFYQMENDVFLKDSWLETTTNKVIILEYWAYLGEGAKYYLKLDFLEGQKAHQKYNGERFEDAIGKKKPYSMPSTHLFSPDGKYIKEIPILTENGANLFFYDF